MISKMTLTVSGFALALAGAVALGSPARAERAMTMGYCASGYHADAQGHCQPDGQNAYDGPCQPGFYYQVFPNGNGYRCVQNGY